MPSRRAPVRTGTGAAPVAVATPGNAVPPDAAVVTAADKTMGAAVVTAADTTVGAAADETVGTAVAGTAPVPTAPSRLRRVLRGVVIGLVLLITFELVVLLVGMRLNDREIDRHLGTATATVLTVGPLHTGIEFVDDRAETIRPPTGVLYPGLLSVGQRFLVEYSTATPTVVRVAGRTAAVGNVVVAVAAVSTWVVGGALLLLLRRPRPPGRRGPGGRAGFRGAAAH